MFTQRTRHRVTIQEKISAQNSTTGAEEFFWRDRYVGVPAEVLTGAGFLTAEQVISQSIQAQVDCRINIRWLPGLDAKQRILWKFEEAFLVFDIAGITYDKTGRKEAYIKCRTGVNDG